jgi:cytochrome P450
MAGSCPYASFDHNSPNHRSGIGPTWDAMRALPELPQSACYGGFYVVTRYDDVAAVTRQHQIFSSAAGIAIPDLHFDGRLLPLESDPPTQGNYRRIVLPFLARSAVARNEAFIRALAVRLLDNVRGQGEFDFGLAFALPLPCRTMLEFLGLPGDDAPALDRLINTSIDGRGTQEGQAAGQELNAYLSRFIETCAAAPRDPDKVVSTIAHSMIDGEPIGHDERLSLTKLLLFGGFTTATFVLTSTMHWMGQHPEDWSRLAADPALLKDAIEEFVRYASPGTYLGRTVVRGTELGGTSLHPGDKVLVSYGSANRDPAMFAKPERIDLDRRPTQHMGFGHGTHACIGLHLARLELQIAFEELLGRIASFEVDGSRPVDWTSGETQGITSLKLSNICWK